MSISIFTKTKNSFEGQLPDENTQLLLRSHPFILVSEGIGLAGALIVLLLFIVIGEYAGDVRISDIVWFSVSLGYMFWWYSLFYLITMYLLNVWIITDKRIIVSNQKGLFKRTVAELDLSKIQDISVDIDGFFGTTLNFGNLEIQSAAVEKKFLLKNISNPVKVKDEIMRLYREEK